MGYIYTFELSATPIFMRCPTFQIAPQVTAVFRRPQQSSCVACVLLAKYKPQAGLAPAFANEQAKQTFPPACRFDVAQS